MPNTSSVHGFDLMMSSDRLIGEETSIDLETECGDSSGINDEYTVEEITGSDPYVGMKFKSADDARVFYDEYGRRHGFTIRVNRKQRSRKDREVIGYDYVCSREGFRRKRTSREVNIRFSKQPRVGCKAMLVIAYRRNSENWVVTNFVREHNHELMVPSEVPVRRPDKANNEDEKDKRIRELTARLYNDRQKFERQCAIYEERCATYKMQLEELMKDIDVHTENLTKRVESVVHNIKEIED
ncbi:hypothetical protein GIB67_032566 [Kingdonia uniflora]|uniref:FAR1 domain-containing protein n=1 Tax=Kingdonia uniflora TaxID=39325 RepID=A0A7J7LS09_9MAGN|nr:hypothetical protein GIB67_032566 [Kingdonia uniflora]